MEKTLKLQEAFRGVSLFRMKSAFKCLNNYESTVQLSLTHNHITQEALRPQEDPLADYLSLPIHVIDKSFLNREINLMLLSSSYQCIDSCVNFPSPHSTSDFNDLLLQL